MTHKRYEPELVNYAGPGTYLGPPRVLSADRHVAGRHVRPGIAGTIYGCATNGLTRPRSSCRNRSRMLHTTKWPPPANGTNSLCGAVSMSK